MDSFLIDETYLQRPGIVVVVMTAWGWISAARRSRVCFEVFARGRRRGRCRSRGRRRRLIRRLLHGVVPIGGRGRRRGQLMQSARDAQRIGVEVGKVSGRGRRVHHLSRVVVLIEKRSRQISLFHRSSWNEKFEGRFTLNGSRVEAVLVERKTLLHSRLSSHERYSYVWRISKTSAMKKKKTGTQDVVSRSFVYQFASVDWHQEFSLNDRKKYSKKLFFFFFPVLCFSER